MYLSRNLFDIGPRSLPVADPGGLAGLTPPPQIFFACHYMKLPADLDPKPTPLKNSGPEPPPPPPPPPEEFLGPPVPSRAE